MLIAEVDVDVVDFKNASKKGKTQNMNDLIEIFDSSDEDEIVPKSQERKYDKMKKTTSNASAMDDDGENMRMESNGNNSRVLKNLIPNRDENRSSTDSGHAAVASTSCKDQHNKTKQTPMGMKPKITGANRFKCNQCPLAFSWDSNLKRHQKIHIREKSMGVVQDRNGLYSCTHCIRQFQEFTSLKIHMRTIHKNNQYLFNCTHCMTSFTRENEKNAHESQCQRRRYECFLCKSFDTVHKSQMEDHMRLHSGAKPFQCAVCNKFFRLKKSLKYHLDFIHCKRARQQKL